MKKSLNIFALLLFCVTINAQVDTEFWFAAPDLSSAHFESCVKLRFITFDKGTTVTVTQPANTAFTPKVISIGANSFGTLELGTYLSQIETKTGSGNSIQKTGLLIKSDADISVYYANTCDNSEIYALKGRNALGTNFIVPTQYEYANSSGYQGGNSVEIVAAEDATSVTITPSQASVGHAKGVPFTITLNKGESFALRASGMSGADHLCNTIIKSDKPVAVNYTDDSVAGPGVDMVGDQLVPVELAGINYLAVKGGGNVEKAYIFPTVDNTSVYAKGIKVATMNAGDKYMHVLADTVTHITSDKPIIVLQITSKGTELGAALLPAIDCTGSREIAYKPASSADPIVTLVTKTENIGNFKVNGTSYLLPPSVFRPVAGYPGWSYTVKTLGAVEILRIKNSTGYFHMGVFDNISNSCGFGYFSNYNVVPLGSVSNKNYYQEGDEIHLSLSDASNLTNIQWTGPNGFMSNEVSPVINNCQLTDGGVYVVTANHIDGCVIEPDTIIVSILKKSQKYISDICYGNNTTLTAPGYSPYSWTPTVLGTAQTATVQPTSTSTYTVSNFKVGYTQLKNGNFESGNVDINTSGSYTYNSTDLSLPGTYSVGNSPKDYNSAYADIKDHTVGDNTGKQMIVNSIQGESTLWEQRVNKLEPGARYAVSLWTTAGSSTSTASSLQYKINGQTAGSSYAVPTDGKWHKYDYVWTSDSENATISVNTTNTTTSGSLICLDDIHFAALFEQTDTFLVQVRDSLKPTLAGDNYICQGSATIGADIDYDSYKWNTGATTKSISVTQPGNYWLKTTAGSCSGTGYFTVSPSPQISLSVNTVSEVCPGEGNVDVAYELSAGEIGQYDVLYDSKSKEAGFVDEENKTISTTGTFTLALPTSVSPGIYSAQVKAYEKHCGESQLFPVSIKVRYSPDILTQRWNDVIAVTNENYNGGYTFNSYQWYKNGTKLVGETKPYLYEQPTLSETDRYSVELTRTSDNTTLMTCDFMAKLFTDADIVNRIVAPGEIINLKKLSETGIAKAVFWTITGNIRHQEITDAANVTISAPYQKGIYILQVCTDKLTKEYKIIVK